jgi:secondary thiamine-phosphate synthase enzyme
MEIETTEIEFSTKGKTDIIDITPKVNQVLSDSGFREGHVILFSIGSTSGLSTIEYEPGLVQHDVSSMFDNFAPYGDHYQHNLTWGDDNGAAHLRSTITGTSLNIPFRDGKLMIGTWQQVAYFDFDTRPRSRKVVVQLIGKKES